MRISRALSAVAAVTGSLMLSLTVVAPASAGPGGGGPAPVDPATITPPLNPTFSWDCRRAGTNTICDGERSDAWEAVNTEIPCGDGWLWSTGTDDRTLRRFGDALGRAVRTQGHATIRETLSLSPDMSGPTASLIGQFNDRYRYSTPGDLSTRVQVISGIDLRVTVVGQGVVVRDVGVKAFDIEDNELFAHGPKDLEDFDAAFARICAALLADA
jgi:hypothetical protein